MTEEEYKLRISKLEEDLAMEKRRVETCRTVMQQYVDDGENYHWATKFSLMISALEVSNV